MPILPSKRQPVLLPLLPSPFQPDNMSSPIIHGMTGLDEQPANIRCEPPSSRSQPNVAYVPCPPVTLPNPSIILPVAGVNLKSGHQEKNHLQGHAERKTEGTKGDSRTRGSSGADEFEWLVCVYQNQRSKRLQLLSSMEG